MIIVWLYYGTTTNVYTNKVGYYFSSLCMYTSKKMALLVLCQITQRAISGKKHR